MFTNVYFHFKIMFKWGPQHFIIIPEKGLGDYLVYQSLLIPGYMYLYHMREKLQEVEMTYVFEYYCPLFLKDKRSGLGFRFSAQYFKKEFFFSKIYIYFFLGGGGVTAPLAPPLATASCSLPPPNSRLQRQGQHAIFVCLYQYFFIEKGLQKSEHYLWDQGQRLILIKPFISN